MSIARRNKQPNDVGDFDVTFPDFFERNTTDYITDVPTLTVTGTGATPDLILGPGTHPSFQLLGSPAKSVRIWLSEGVSGTTYKVEGVILTNELRNVEFEFNVKVKDL